AWAKEWRGLARSVSPRIPLSWGCSIRLHADWSCAQSKFHYRSAETYAKLHAMAPSIPAYRPQISNETSIRWSNRESLFRFGSYEELRYAMAPGHQCDAR